MVAGVTYVTNASTKPWSSHKASLKSHLPVINTAEANGISTIAHNRSLAAKAMIYKLVVDRSLWFLYTAKQTRVFPMILMMAIARHTVASMMTTAKLRSSNSIEDIPALKLWMIRNWTTKLLSDFTINAFWTRWSQFLCDIPYAGFVNTNGCYMTNQKQTISKYPLLSKAKTFPQSCVHKAYIGRWPCIYTGICDVW